LSTGGGCSALYPPPPWYPPPPLKSSPAPSGLATPHRKQLDLDAKTRPQPAGQSQSPGLRDGALRSRKPPPPPPRSFQPPPKPPPPPPRSPPKPRSPPCWSYCGDRVVGDVLVSWLMGEDWTFSRHFRALGRRLLIVVRARSGDAPSRRRPRVWARRSGSSWTWMRTRFRIRWGRTSRRASRWRSRLRHRHRGHLGNRLRPPRRPRTSCPCRLRGRRRNRRRPGRSRPGCSRRRRPGCPSRLCRSLPSSKCQVSRARGARRSERSA